MFFTEETKKPRTRRKRIHEMTLNEFTRGLPVVKEEDFGPYEINSIKRAKEIIEHAFGTFQSNGEDSISEEFNVPHDDLRLFKVKGYHWPILTTRDTNELVGGIVVALTYVTEEHRGKGYSKYFHLTFDGKRNPFLAPGHYSPGGYGARKSAHREAVRIALSKGLDVPQENLELYAEELPEAQEALDAITTPSLGM